jgi:co-chaperonin GroES (HSP10)
MEGEVVAVGDGRRTDNGQLVPMSVKTGDRVVVCQVQRYRIQSRRCRLSRVG